MWKGCNFALKCTLGPVERPIAAGVLPKAEMVLEARDAWTKIHIIAQVWTVKLFGFMIHSPDIPASEEIRDPSNDRMAVQLAWLTDEKNVEIDWRDHFWKSDFPNPEDPRRDESSLARKLHESVFPEGRLTINCPHVHVVILEPPVQKSRRPRSEHHRREEKTDQYLAPCPIIGNRCRARGIQSLISNVLRETVCRACRQVSSASQCKQAVKVQTTFPV